MKTFNISNDRILKLGKNNEIHILNQTTKKEAVFTPTPWVSFLLRLDDIWQPIVQTQAGSGRCLPKPLRRRMLRVCDERFSLHRSALIRAVRGKPSASPPRPVSHYVSANGYHLSSRLSPTYTATTRVSPTLYHASSARTTRLHRVSPHAKSAVRFLPPLCNYILPTITTEMLLGFTLR